MERFIINTFLKSNPILHKYTGYKLEKQGNPEQSVVWLYDI